MKVVKFEGNLLDDEQVYIDDPVKVYLAEVDQVPPLTRAEEILCIQHIRAGDQEALSAGTRLAEANLHLVVAIAERYRKGDIHILDLIQKGNEGLLHALQTLSEDDQVSFAEQATPHIEKAIKRAIAFQNRSGPSIETTLERNAADCGKFEMPRAEFDQAESQIIEPGEPQ
jgi:RNA polymerase primary sigma factor